MTVDVLILGAGVSGLTTAWALKDSSLSVQVCEARERIGGRTYSPVIQGHRFDLGASWIWDHEEAVHGLVRALGVGTFASLDDEGDDLAELGPGAVQRGRLPRAWVPARRIAGGTQSIVEALAGQLASDSLVTKQVAERIELNGPASVRVHFEGGGCVDARRVVAALPPPLVASLVPSLDDATDEWLRRTPTWMADIAKVVAVYETSHWRARGLSGRAVSRRGPMVEVHDLSSETGAAAVFGFAPRTAYAQAADAPAFEAAIRDQLARLFGPQAPDPVHVEVMQWWTEPYTVAVDAPPADQRLFGHSRLREPLLDGRLHLASTETAAENPGHIDGAVRRAFEVAALVSGQ